MLAPILQNSLQALGLPDKSAPLLAYLQALLLWNKAYNLTAITDPKEALVKHIIDCLAIVPYIRSGSVLDVGTGAGLPAVVLAIMRNDVRIDALDANSKKVRFVRQVAHELALDNLAAVHSRIEAHTVVYDGVVSRAFANTDDFFTQSAHNLADDGVWYAMMGKATAQTKGELIKLCVPNLADTRHLWILPKQDYL